MPSEAPAVAVRLLSRAVLPVVLIAVLIALLLSRHPNVISTAKMSRLGQADPNSYAKPGKWTPGADAEPRRDVLPVIYHFAFFSVGSCVVQLNRLGL